MTTRGAMIVIGSGPGIGQATAAHFAKRGFKHVILLSRNESRLSEEAAIVKSAGAPDATVDILRIDVNEDEASIKRSLTTVDAKLKAANVPLELVVYNACRVGVSKIMEWEAKGLEEDLRATTVSLYIVLQWAIPQLQQTARSTSLNPAFLTTSGGLCHDPFPYLFSLSAGKASQYNLMQSFHKKFEPEVHIGCILVNGFVSENQKVTTPANAAAHVWTLYEQTKGKQGRVDVALEEPDYLSSIEGTRKVIEGV